MSKLSTYLIHGSLGSGKTTILKHILSDARFAKSVVVENEYANVNLDKDFIAQEHGHINILDVSGGCICCTSSQDLFTALQTVRQTQGIQHVFVETTGVSSSAQLIKQLMLSHEFDGHFTLVKNIFVIDALEDAPDRLRTEKMLDLLMADLAVLHKIDLVDEQKLVSFRAMLNSIPGLSIVEAAQGNVPADRIYSATPSRAASALLEHVHLLQTADHGADVQYQVLYPTKAVTDDAVRTALHRSAKKGAQVMRIKGYVTDPSGNKRLVHGTRQFLTFENAPTIDAQDVLVCIGPGVTKESIQPLIECVC